MSTASAESAHGRSANTTSATESWAPHELFPDDIGCEATVLGLMNYLESASDLRSELVRAKAIVFRGFNVNEDSLDQVLNTLVPNRLAYVHGNSPRTKVGKNVYTSTEYPPELTISMHNELSYAHEWPARLVFYCSTAAQTGGATPLVDGHQWLSSLDREIRTSFAPGVRYQQNLHDGFGLGKSWQDTFETGDRQDVERFLNGNGSDWEWRRDGGLRISQLRSASIRHPVSGAEVWFNQADQWHPAGLGDETAAELAQILPPQDLPQSVSFADGSPIPSEYAMQIRDRGLENAIDVNWHVGDLLVIDNVLVAHGRRPFTGDRRVLVAMSD